jgi:DNA polymerase V
MLLDLAPAGAIQGGLFDRPDSPRAQARMQALDHLNRRFGRDTVTYTAAGIACPWKMQHGSLSRRYSTCWDELLNVGDKPGRGGH